MKFERNEKEFRENEKKKKRENEQKIDKIEKF